MISSKIQSILHNDIQIYDKKNGKDYLVVFGKGKNDTLKWCQLSFNNYNFWHLLGCKVKNKNHHIIYENCKAKKDVMNDISLVHSHAEADVKHVVFNNVFDFVANAKFVKIGYVEDSPEQFYLTMSIGNNIGFIGYDYPKNGNKNFLIPKSVQNKKISIVTKNTYKILFILSKQQNQKSYTTIEYEIKDKICNEYLPEISQTVQTKIVL